MWWYATKYLVSPAYIPSSFSITHHLLHVGSNGVHLSSELVVSSDNLSLIFLGETCLSRREGNQTQEESTEDYYLLHGCGELKMKNRVEL